MRVIDSNELKEWVENWFEKHHYYHPYSKADSIPITELYDLMEQMPTVDAEPVRHGRWIFNGYKRLIPVCECSLCSNVEPADWAILGNIKYCPNCGAKMDGGTDNETL